MKARHALGILLIGIGLSGIIVSLFVPVEIHEHADFAVYVEGNRINFSRPDYMSDNGELSEKIHLHDMDGNVMHKHAEGATLGMFFESIGIVFNETCFNGHCTNDSSRLIMYVNGMPSYEYGMYEFSDLDRILIIFGNMTGNITAHMDAVTSDSCIYSGKCPERGDAPDENSCSGNVCLPIS